MSLAQILLSFLAIAVILGVLAAVLRSKPLAWVAGGLFLVTVLFFVVGLLTFGG